MDFKPILNFWFEELTPAQWWKKDPEMDQNIAQKFGATHKQAVQGELFTWRSSPEGRLAEIIVVDQFSRNIFRDRPESFLYDPLALCLSQTLIATGDDKKLGQTERLFAYLPFMHSESSLIHEQAVTLYTELGLQENLEFEYKHKAIIDRFGRYPHRNRILGRISTLEEVEFLKGPGSSF